MQKRIAYIQKSVQPRFIAVEGIDGAGKTTLIEHIVSYLYDSGISDSVLHVREPGSSTVGNTCRSLLLSGASQGNIHTDIVLMCVSRSVMLNTLVRPHLRGNLHGIPTSTVAISDRYIDSTWAYQVYPALADSSVVRTLESVECELNIDILPGLTIYLKLDVETSKARRAGKDAVEGRDDAYYEKVLKGYEYQIENKHPDQQYCVIDATQSFESVQNEATAAVSRYFKLKTTRSDSDA